MTIVPPEPEDFTDDDFATATARVRAVRERFRARQAAPPDPKEPPA